MRPTRTQSIDETFTAAREEREADSRLEQEGARRERVSCPRCERHVRGKLPGICDACTDDLRSAEYATEPYDPEPVTDWELLYCEGLHDGLEKLSARAQSIARLVQGLSGEFLPHTLSTGCEAAIFALSSFEADEDCERDAPFHASVGTERAEETFHLNAEASEREAVAAGYTPAEEDIEDEHTSTYLSECDVRAWTAIEDAALRAVGLVERHPHAKKLSMLTRFALDGLAEGDCTSTGIGPWNNEAESFDEWCARKRIARSMAIQTAMDASVKRGVARMEHGSVAVF